MRREKMTITMAGDFPTAFNGCTCPCHRNHGIAHVMACCYPKLQPVDTFDAQDVFGEYEVPKFALGQKVKLKETGMQYRVGGFVTFTVPIVQYQLESMDGVWLQRCASVTELESAS